MYTGCMLVSVILLVCVHNAHCPVDDVYIDKLPAFESEIPSRKGMLLPEVACFF